MAKPTKIEAAAPEPAPYLTAAQMRDRALRSQVVRLGPLLETALAEIGKEADEGRLIAVLALTEDVVKLETLLSAALERLGYKVKTVREHGVLQLRVTW